MKILFLFLTCLGIFLSRPAEAMKFGLHDSLHKIQDIEMKGKKGEDLFLGHRTTIIFIVAGVHLIDRGYILGIKGKSEYYALTSELIQTLQADKVLPNPLPQYTIGAIDYLFGYSLWIIIVWVAGYMALKSYFKRRKSAQNPSL